MDTKDTQKALQQLTTETNNERSRQLSEIPTMDMLTIINNEDKLVAFAVEKELPSITAAVDGVAERLKSGGRMFYFGAGTSGRLGVIDASEIPCTFGSDPTLIQAVIAGGRGAVYDAAVGDEDNYKAGTGEILLNRIGPNDVVVGITASGRTPFVMGAINKANDAGAYTIGICNNKASALSKIVKVCIDPDTGPEVIEGSTRMKAGTAQKMILNMLSTGIMVKLGHVYQNYMINMVPNNEKLYHRAVRIVADCAKTDSATAEKALESCDYRINIAIVMIIKNCSKEKAVRLLEENGNSISKVKLCPM